MPIKIGGQVDVNAPRARVWDEIFNVETLKKVIGRVPGIMLERLEQTDDLTYELTATVGVAAIKGKYNGKITVVEKVPPSHVKIRGEGKGSGNFTSGDVVLDLTEVGNHTLMVYSGNGNLNGPLASLGQRLVDTVGKSFIDQGARIFASEIESSTASIAIRMGAESDAGDHAAVPMESHAEPAAPTVFGFGLQSLVLVATVGAIAAIIVLRISQSWPR